MDEGAPARSLSTLPHELLDLVCRLQLAEWMRCAEDPPDSQDFFLKRTWKAELKQAAREASAAVLALRATCRFFAAAVKPLILLTHVRIYHTHGVPAPYARFALGHYMLWSTSRRSRLSMEEHNALYTMLSATLSQNVPTPPEKDYTIPQRKWLRAAIRILDALFREEAVARAALAPDFWQETDVRGEGMTLVLRGGLLLRESCDVLHFVTSHRLSRASVVEAHQTARWRTETVTHLLGYVARFSLALNPPSKERTTLSFWHKQFAALVRNTAMFSTADDPSPQTPPASSHVVPSVNTAHLLLKHGLAEYCTTAFHYGFA